MAQVVAFKKAEQPEKTFEMLIAYETLADAELIRLMLETLDEVNRRARYLRQHSQNDVQGRLWSITAIMRAANRRVDNIRHIVGFGVVR